MRNALIWIGRLVAVLGVAIMVAAVGFRLGGIYFIGNLQVGTLLNVGLAGMVLACVCFLAALTSRGPGQER